VFRRTRAWHTRRCDDRKCRVNPSSSYIIVVRGLQGRRTLKCVHNENEECTPVDPNLFNASRKVVIQLEQGVLS